MKTNRPQNIVPGLLTAALLATTCLAAGCSGNASSPEDTPAQTAAPVTEGGTAAQATPQQRTAQASPSAQAPPTISGIPLDVWPDVWFDDPLAVANTGTTNPPAVMTAAAPANSAPQTEAPANTESPAPAVPPSGDGPSGAPHLSADAIQLEAKEIRLALKQAFQSVQRYNGNYKDVQTKGSIMAALAFAAENQPDDITWKRNSSHVRDLAAKLTATAAGLGRQYYDPAQQTYEQLEQLLSGNVPAGLGEPAANPRLDEFAPRPKLMKRLQQSDEWMKANTADENGFRSQTEQLRHEIAMVAFLAAVTARKEYDLADVPEYATQAQALNKAAQDAARAAEQMDFAAYSKARENMTKACTACHLDFRFDAE